MNYWQSKWRHSNILQAVPNIKGGKIVHFCDINGGVN